MYEPDSTCVSFSLRQHDACVWTLVRTVQGEGEDERLVQGAQQEASKGVERECVLLLTRLQVLATHALVSSLCHPFFTHTFLDPSHIISKELARLLRDNTWHLLHVAVAGVPYVISLVQHVMSLSLRLPVLVNCHLQNTSNQMRYQTTSVSKQAVLRVSEW